MCCFSREVTRVTNTSIFARTSEGARQFLAYQMALDTKEEVAMILPLPVPPNPGENAVRFVNLDVYPSFFDDLAGGVFPPDRMGGAHSRALPTLAVVDVGSFQASFVPTISDFSRLDPRFRLPAGTWDQLPQYKDWGFAVFKLKPGARTIHPMAFDFPRRDGRQLFFPTVHIHDGLVHETADFDHALYCQHRTEEKLALGEWVESKKPASQFMDLASSHGLVNAGKHVYGLKLKGQLRNQDTVLRY